VKRAGALAFLIFVVCVCVALAAPPAAGAQEVLPDAIPTAWHRQVHAEALLTAPPPPNPVTICVVDTGVTPTPDLDITARYAFDGGTLDDVTAKPGEPGHGTTVAHFAAAAVNGWGGAGIFPHARIASVRVFPEEGGAAWQDYIKAFDRCERLDPATRVIVMSLGSQSIEPREAEELDDKITRARDNDNTNVVVAAGNTGGTPDFPGRFPSALTVAAAQPSGDLCPSSARGPDVDLSAPGCGIVQAGWDGSHFVLDGTSFATPIVAGALAAIRAYRPTLTALEAEQVLLASTTAGPMLQVGAAIPNERRPQVAFGVESEPGDSTLHRPVARSESAPRTTIRARRVGKRRVLVTARPRINATRLEVRIGHRLKRSRALRIFMTTRARSIRARLLRPGQRRAWTVVPVTGRWLSRPFEFRSTPRG
jgi:hypothetical protein